MLSHVLQSPMLRSFRHRAFRRMALANTVSITGTWMQTIAQSWLVLELTGSTAALGGSIALQAGPSVLFGLWGGAVVDRHDKRRLLVITQVVLAVLATVLAVVSSGPALTVGVLYALAVATGIVRVFDGPANATFAAQMVGREDLANAAALGAVINSAGRVVGMSLGGVVIALWGAGAVFWFNAVSYLLVAAVLTRLRPSDLRPLETADRDRSGVRDGLAYVRTHPELVALLLLSLVLSSFGRNFQVTMAAMTEGAFGLGADAYGVVSTVFAVGAVLGATAAARLGRPTARTVLGYAAALAILESLAGAMPGLGTFSAAILGLGALAVVLDTAVQANAQLSVEESFRGRVLSLFGMTGMAGTAIGAPALGLLADVAGPRGALVLGGVITGVATAATWWTLRPAPTGAERRPALAR